MRRLVGLVIVLLILPFVYAQCGDGSIDPGEECDSNIDYNCPGMCDQNTCTCMKEVDQVLIDLYSGHNLLFSKAQDLAHISKDAVMQDELKVIQYGLRQAYVNPPNGSACQTPPGLFMSIANMHPYGKENEIDAFNKYLLFKLSDTTFRQQVNVSNMQYNNASTLQGIADAYLAAGNYLRSAQAKCCAYNQLIENESLYLTVNGSCDVLLYCGDGKIKPGEQCGEPGLPPCPVGETCINCVCHPTPPPPPPGGGGRSGGGSFIQLQRPVACCQAYGYREGSVYAEYSCCSENMTECCHNPELSQCAPYCKVLSCVEPYELVGGRCVKSKVEVVQPPAASTPPQQEVPQPQQCGPGYEMVNGACVQKAEKKPEGKIVTARKGSLVTIASACLFVLILALLAYMVLSRRKPEAPKKAEQKPVEKQIEKPVQPEKKPVVMPKLPKVDVKNDNFDKMSSELADLEKSYDQLDKMIKSLKGGKL
ncbi:hypothetical protein KY309_00705 [Candidatus Woesearchaeota archaeon]|nr:hypothetical protein [Candidatus Woesearchaeota archaeon]